MITFAQISGGRTSGYMAEMLKNKPDTVFMFQNTGREKPETYDLLDKMDKEWNLNLIWLEYHCPVPSKKATVKTVSYKTVNKDGKPFSELIEKRKAIPNKFKRFCSAELKVKTARRWIRSQGILRWNYAIGYRADEPARLVRSDTMQNAITPLKDAGVNLPDIKDFWSRQHFDLDLPILPNGKTFGGNCEGCFWHSEFQHANLCKTHPQSVQWLINHEEKKGFTFNEKYSYKDLMAHVEKSPEFIFTNEKHFCMETNGSCGI